MFKLIPERMCKGEILNRRQKGKVAEYMAHVN